MPESDPNEKADTDALIDRAMAPQALKMAGYLLAGAGVFELAVGLQSALIAQAHVVIRVSAWVMLLAGAAAIAVGAKLARGREWSLAPAVVLAALMSAGSMGFFVWSFTHGVFSPLALLGVGAAVTAAVFVGLAITPFKKMRDVRRLLRARGVDLDFDF